MKETKRKVLFIILNEYADWEGAYLAPCLRMGMMPGSPIDYEVKTVGPTSDVVTSLGGFRIIPDYSFETMPDDYAAIVMPGGMRWDAPEAEGVVPIVKKAICQGKIVGAICNGASFMAKHGFLNNIRHTGNGIEQLRLWGGDAYTNEARFVESQAVSDQNIVTANGTGAIEFTRELLSLLKADTEERIGQYYDFTKHGFFKE